jgi:hypothetical protein
VRQGQIHGRAGNLDKTTIRRIDITGVAMHACTGGDHSQTHVCKRFGEEAARSFTAEPALIRGNARHDFARAFGHASRSWQAGFINRTGFINSSADIP